MNEDTQAVAHKDPYFWNGGITAIRTEERAEWHAKVIADYKEAGLSHRIITDAKQLENATLGSTIRCFETVLGKIAVLTLQHDGWYGAWDWESALPVGEFLPALLISDETL